MLKASLLYQSLQIQDPLLAKAVLKGESFAEGSRSFVLKGVICSERMFFERAIFFCSQTTALLLKQ
jgi:hypothetical protein